MSFHQPLTKSFESDLLVAVIDRVWIPSGVISSSRSDRKASAGRAASRRSPRGKEVDADQDTCSGRVTQGFSIRADDPALVPSSRNASALGSSTSVLGSSRRGDSSRNRSTSPNAFPEQVITEDL